MCNDSCNCVAFTESLLWWGAVRCLLASSLNTPKTNPLLPLSSAINISFHVWMGGWVWLKGPRVVSVARLHVIISSVKKTSLFVKSPQEQNVPLQQECVVCPHVLLCLGVCLPEPHWWLAGWSWWHLGCHWAAWLVSYVITKAWLHTGTIKNVVEYTEAFSILSLILLFHPTFKQPQIKQDIKDVLFKCFFKKRKAITIDFPSLHSTISSSFSCITCQCENEKWNVCVRVCGTGIMKQSKSIRL